MAQAKISSHFTEVKLFGSVVFTSREVETLLVQKAMDEHPALFERPAVSEGQIGWEVARKITLSVDDNEVILGVQNTWTRIAQ